MPENYAPGWERELLESAASTTQYPPTPPLAASVLARIQERGGAPSPNHRLVWATGGSVVALLLSATISFLASGNCREAVADFLGLAVENEVI